MPKKKKSITIKQITDAFYSGESVEKIKKMAELLVKQSRTLETEYTRKNHFDK
jgi:hypothetical protein